MMATIERTDIEQHFDRLLRLGEKCGADTDEWVLTEPVPNAEPRQPWVVHNGPLRVLTLGYTRRDALSSLAAMTNILAVILGA